MTRTPVQIQNAPPMGQLHALAVSKEVLSLDAASICICFRICVSSAAERVISCTSPDWPTASHRLAPYRWAAGLAQSQYSWARADLERSQRAGGEREKENVPTWAPSKSPGPRTSLSRFLVRFGFVAALLDVGGL